MLQENLFYPLFHCSALSLDPDRQYPIHIFLCRPVHLCDLPLHRSLLCSSTIPMISSTFSP